MPWLAGCIADNGGVVQTGGGCGIAVLCFQPHEEVVAPMTIRSNQEEVLLEIERLLMEEYASEADGVEGIDMKRSLHDIDCLLLRRPPAPAAATPDLAVRQEPRSLTSTSYCKQPPPLFLSATIVPTSRSPPYLTTFR